MPQNIQPNFILIFTVSISLFGLFTTLMLALYPPTVQENLLWRKPLIGSIFSLICILGITAAFFPNKCSKTFNLLEAEKTAVSNAKDPNFNKVLVTLKGHHPDCEEFSAHVMHISNHTLCAACTGLFIGAFISIIGTAFYFFGGQQINEMSFPAVVIGIVGVILGYLQLKFRGFVRLMLNILFVLGAFLTLVGIDELTQSLSVDLFSIVLIVFWIFTRIMLSHWDHRRICHNCKSPCENRRLEKPG